MATEKVLVGYEGWVQKKTELDTAIVLTLTGPDINQTETQYGFQVKVWHNKEVPLAVAQHIQEGDWIKVRCDDVFSANGERLYHNVEDLVKATPPEGSAVVFTPTAPTSNNKYQPKDDTTQRSIERQSGGHDVKDIVVALIYKDQVTLENLRSAYEMTADIVKSMVHDLPDSEVITIE